MIERMRENGMDFEFEDDKWKNDELVVLTSIEQNIECSNLHPET